MRTKNMFLLILALTMVTGLLSATWAAETDKNDTEALAKASQNPVANLISVPFENNTTFNNGTEDSVVDILNIKPVIPMSFGENWNLINRTIVPVIYQEERFPDEGNRFGLGDITYQGFFSPKKPGKIVWGIGPQLGLPTGMDRLTSNQWTLGPTAVALMMPGHWVAGVLVSNVWDFGGGMNLPRMLTFFLSSTLLTIT